MLQRTRRHARGVGQREHWKQNDRDNFFRVLRSSFACLAGQMADGRQNTRGNYAPGGASFLSFQCYTCPSGRKRLNVNSFFFFSLQHWWSKTNAIIRCNTSSHFQRPLPPSYAPTRPFDFCIRLHASFLFFSLHRALVGFWFVLSGFQG